MIIASIFPPLPSDPETNVYHMDNYIYLRKDAGAALARSFDVENDMDDDYVPFSPVSVEEWERRVAEQNNALPRSSGLVLPVNHWKLTKELMKIRRKQA